MSKTAVEGTVEIVKTITPEEWSKMIAESAQTMSEATTAIAEFAAALNQAVEDAAVAITVFKEAWSRVKFTS